MATSIATFQAILKYSIFNRLTFIPLLSNAYLQHPSLRSTSLVSSQITISLAYSIVHGGSLLTSFVSLSKIPASRNGLNADLVFLCNGSIIAALF